MGDAFSLNLCVASKKGTTDVRRLFNNRRDFSFSKGGRLFLRRRGRIGSVALPLLLLLLLLLVLRRFGPAGGR